MAYNKVTFGSKTLIDLTGDTVRSDYLFTGYTAHDKSGKKITGTLFSGYPDSVEFVNTILDSSGNPVLDSSGNAIVSRTVYSKR